MKFIHEQIQYIELLTPNLELVKKFYQEAFGWQFTDYGPAYTAFTGEYVDGGFALGEVKAGSILVVLYSTQLKETEAKILQAGGKLTKEIFEFPGGKRLQFVDPVGNELAVWTDK